MTVAYGNLLAELDTKGYAHIKLFTAEELAVIRGFIGQTIRRALDVEVQPLSAYHATITADQHKTLGSKQNRILSADHADAVLQFQSLQDLIKLFPGYIPAEAVYGQLEVEQRPEVYFRVVRPHQKSDVGPMHRDGWFHELYQTKALGSVSYKLWISIETSAGENGLLIYPEANERPLGYKSIQTADGPRPQPDFDASEAGPAVLIPTQPGDAIVFTDTVLHQGALNAADTTRVSVEITLCKPSS